MARLRFSKLDRVQRDRMIAAIRAGESVKAIAEAFGVSRRTVYNYKAQAEEVELQSRTAVLTVRLNKPDLAALDALAAKHGVSRADRPRRAVASRGRVPGGAARDGSNLEPGAAGPRPWHEHEPDRPRREPCQRPRAFEAGFRNQGAVAGRGQQEQRGYPPHGNGTAASGSVCAAATGDQRAHIRGPWSPGEATGGPYSPGEATGGPYSPGEATGGPYSPGEATGGPYSPGEATGGPYSPGEATGGPYSPGEGGSAPP